MSSEPRLQLLRLPAGTLPLFPADAVCPSELHPFPLMHLPELRVSTSIAFGYENITHEPTQVLRCIGISGHPLYLPLIIEIRK